MTKAELRKARRDRARFREALAPFADVRDAQNPLGAIKIQEAYDYPDDAPVYLYVNRAPLPGCRHHLTVGDFRRAHQAMKRKL